MRRHTSQLAVRALLPALALLLLCLGPARAEELKEATLVLQWQPQAQFAGFYVAEAKGFYRDAGVAMRLVPGGPDVIASRLLASGQAQFATLFLATGIERRAGGMPIVHLAQLVQRSALMLVARATSGIREPKDLDGRRVSLWDNEFQLQPRALFQRLGIHPVVVPQSGSLTLFLRGGVDAASAMWYNEYHSLLASGLDPEELNFFSYRDMELNFPEDGIYAMEKTLNQDPALCRAVVAASLRGWEYALAHPEEALDIVVARRREANLPTSRVHQRFMLARMRDVILGQPGEKLPPLGQLDRADFERVTGVLLQQKLIKAGPDFSAFARGGGK